MATRLISAAIAIPLGLLIIFLDNIWLYTASMAFLSAVALHEIIGAIKCGEYKLLYVITLLLAAATPFVRNFGLEKYYTIILFVYLVAVFSIHLNKHATLKFQHICMIAGSAVVIPNALNCIAMLRYSDNTAEFGSFYLAFGLIAAWVGDGGAYFVGTFFGKHKLCPQISPKKTVEGFFGGLFVSAVVCALMSYGYQWVLHWQGTEASVNWLLLAVIGLVCSALGVLGDLSASLIKREYEIKDFGKLLPGHGGVMDRFDSVIFVAPFLLLVLQYINPITTL